MALPLSYNWRNLLARKVSSGLTFTVVTVVVLVLAVLLSFSAGIGASLVASGSSRNILVLKPGATAESTSIIIPSECVQVMQTPGAAIGPDGRPLISQEICVQTSIPRRGGGAMANVAVRGIDLVGLSVHDEVKIVEGRCFEPGLLEVIVGKAAAERYEGLTLGSRIKLGRFGNRDCEIVGIFESGGSAFESELWAPRSTIADSYARSLASTIVVKLDDPASAPAAMAYIKGPTVQLLPRLETAYYADLLAKTRQIVAVTGILVFIMSIGAVFAVANTMYAAVDGRRREIAMLRTIGFSRAVIVASFVIESVILCLAAAVFGLALGGLLNGSRQDFLSDTTWTVLAFELRVTPGVALSSLALATVVGVAGALVPAIKAARVPILEALRKA
ncbi:Macrolide export ATP-binding/permease protein MacB [Phycisphaerae bacterium RAS1]|nr:Macrolide export ATP-binding/permease protein MacB [Phycisphaerae bacterium RAS1]